MKNLIIILVSVVFSTLFFCSCSKQPSYREQRDIALENSPVVTITSIINLTYVARIGAVQVMTLSDGESIYLRASRAQGEKLVVGNKIKYLNTDIGMGSTSEVYYLRIVE